MCAVSLKPGRFTIALYGQIPARCRANGCVILHVSGTRGVGGTLGNPSAEVGAFYLYEIIMQIADQTVASFHYTLTDDNGQVIDSSQGREPLTYLHGTGQIVPGLEKAMVGRVAGDQFKVQVAPAEGYGEHHPELMQELPREAFQGVEDIQPGMQFQGHGPQGVINVTVTKIDGEKVHIDGNHPLAGQTLHFDIEVTDVREASAEELAHGHVHGAGGHHH
jgi:FKBP-type peptidyl-prolyl cis-trans isomerase SlyD